MLRLDHRASKDIDLFVTDPQVLGYLSPRLAGEAAWNTEEYDESANALKLRYDEGEIDIIVAASISDLATDIYEFEGTQVRTDHPAEIILKKLIYRAASLKPRDVFDTAAVLSSPYGDSLRRELSLIAGSKTIPAGNGLCRKRARWFWNGAVGLGLSQALIPDPGAAGLNPHPSFCSDAGGEVRSFPSRTTRRSCC